jgi:hypothetical protein
MQLSFLNYFGRVKIQSFQKVAKRPLMFFDEGIIKFRIYADFKSIEKLQNSHQKDNNKKWQKINSV